MSYCASMKEHNEAVKEAVEEEITALRARLAECERVAEFFKYAIEQHNITRPNHHMLNAAIIQYEAYKLSNKE